MKVLITGGGTGGHVAPALAVIAALRSQDPAVQLRYVGSPTGIEAKLAPEAGVEFVGIATGKLRRAANPLKMLTLQNLRDLARVPLGVVQAFRAVRSFKPDVVFSTGGYVCVPTVLAAALLRVPVLTHEQTVTIGLANRIAGRFAKQIALTFDESRKLLSAKLAAKASVTGNPLRSELFSGSASNWSRFGFRPADAGLPCVYVTGGAQGAHVINRAVADAAGDLLPLTRVLHQCGTADNDDLQHHRNLLPPELADRWQIRPFIERDEIGDAWAMADVVLARAGAGTVSEAAALGKPVVFVPLEPTSADEQLKNAQRCADVGAALIVRQADCSGPAVLAALEPLLRSPSRRQTMGERNATLATPNAAGELAQMVAALAKHQRK
jgi:UDP-N-acetylglucosamine--N-acetylmuramyl-(pentapeptide) pyrophosphoryl-undecaprenol N-acetylglucosamine transferase